MEPTFRLEPPFTGRHAEVLEAGLALIADRGIAGASLRELARRLGMSQPSLYHYFASKDELIEQIVQHAGANMMTPRAGAFTLPDSLEALPALIAHFVSDIYERDGRHIAFVRFMFAVSLERPDLRPHLGAFFGRQMTRAIDLLMAPWVARGELTAQDARHLSLMVSRAIGLAYIEQYVLTEAPDRQELAAYARFVVGAAVHTLRARRPIPT